MTFVRRALLLACAALAGCDQERPVVDPEPSPRVDQAVVEPGPNNVLSAVVTARVEGADSVAVRYGPIGGALDSVTPASRPSGEEVILPVLGLLPATEYRMQVVAYGLGQEVSGSPLPFISGDLPPDLPSYTASGVDPTTGYVVFASGAYGLVIDNSGRVVWYRKLPGPTLNFQVQPTGFYTSSPTTPDSTDPEPWVEYDHLGTVTRTLGCARGLRPRFHDLLVQDDGSYWIMCDETRVMDLSSLGGMSAAQVTGTVVQYLSSAKPLLFEWSAFDHFALTDLDSASRAGPTVNWTHGNAIDVDQAGNLLVSFRSLSEITKIDGNTGTIIWRMGGRANQFSFPTGAMPFLRQHGLRVIGPGRIQLLDNLGEPTGSRAEQYQIDESLRSAGLVASYSSVPGVTALLGGTTQQLPGGRILVAYGNGSRVQEYDQSGTVVWELQGSPGYVFRAQRIISLYHPGVGTAR